MGLNARNVAAAGQFWNGVINNYYKSKESAYQDEERTRLQAEREQQEKLDQLAGITQARVGEQTYVDPVQRRMQVEDEAAFGSEGGAALREGLSYAGNAPSAEKSYTGLDAARDIRRQAASAGIGASKSNKAANEVMQAGLGEMQFTEATRKADKEKVRYEIDSSLGKQFQESLLGEDGKQRQPTAEDFARFDKMRIGKFTGAGLYDEGRQALKDYRTNLTDEIKLKETQLKAAASDAAVALKQGRLDAVQSSLQAAYSAVPNGEKIEGLAKVGDKYELTMSDGGQVATRVVSEQQLKDMIEVMAGGAGAIVAQETRKLEQKLRQAQIAASMASTAHNVGAESRAAELHGFALPAAKVASELGTLRMSYAKTEDPAEKEKIGKQISALQATGGADKDAPSEVKLANAFLRSGLAKTDAEALKMATTTKDLSPEKMRFELTKTLTAQLGSNPSRVKKQVDEIMSTLGAGAPGGGASAPPAKAGWGVKELK